MDPVLLISWLVAGFMGALAGAAVSFVPRGKGPKGDQVILTTKEWNDWCGRVGVVERSISTQEETSKQILKMVSLEVYDEAQAERNTIVSAQRWKYPYHEVAVNEVLAKVMGSLGLHLDLVPASKECVRVRKADTKPGKPGKKGGK